MSSTVGMVKTLGIFALMLFGGIFLTWRITQIPSRVEIVVLVTLLVFLPTLKYPKFGMVYILFITAFVPFLRRLYYLLSARPGHDPLLLLSDGAMVTLFVAILMYWMVNKERNKDKLTIVIFAYIILLIMKIFVFNLGTIMTGAMAFKIYGLYTLMYFSSHTLIKDTKQLERLFFIASLILFGTAVYSMKQILFGYTDFELKWIDAIAFTTIYIEGNIRTFSTLASPAALSDAMSILAVFGIYFIFKKNPLLKLFGIALSGSCLMPLLYATVRSNWIATFMSFLVFSLLYWRLNWKITVINLCIIPAAIIAIMNYSSLNATSAPAEPSTSQSGNKTMSEVMIKNRTSAITNPLEEYSMNKRMETWTYIIYDIWFKYPFGRGLGTTGYAHSHYFQIFGEAGYPGIILFITLLVWFIVRGVRLSRHKNRDIGMSAAIATTIIIVISVLNITGTHINSHPADIYFWFSGGVLAMLHRISKNEEEASTATTHREPA